MSEAMRFRVGDVVRPCDGYGGDMAQGWAKAKIVEVLSHGGLRWEPLCGGRGVGPAGSWWDRPDRLTLVSRSAENYRPGDRVEVAYEDGERGQGTLTDVAGPTCLVRSEVDGVVHCATRDLRPLPPCPACEAAEGHCGRHGSDDDCGRDGTTTATATDDDGCPVGCPHVRGGVCVASASTCPKEPAAAPPFSVPVEPGELRGFDPLFDLGDLVRPTEPGNWGLAVIEARSFTVGEPWMYRAVVLEPRAVEGTRVEGECSLFESSEPPAPPQYERERTDEQRTNNQRAASGDAQRLRTEALSGYCACGAPLLDSGVIGGEPWEGVCTAHCHEKRQAEEAIPPGGLDWDVAPDLDDTPREERAVLQEARSAVLPPPVDCQDHERGDGMGYEWPTVHAIVPRRRR